MPVTKIRVSAPAPHKNPTVIEDHPQFKRFTWHKVGVLMPQKLEFACHKSRLLHQILCESPLISRDFYAIRPLISWHIFGSVFLLIWGWGLSKLFSNYALHRVHPTAHQPPNKWHCGYIENSWPGFILCCDPARLLEQVFRASGPK